MPRPSLSITQIKVEKEINKLDSVLNGTQALPANLQYLIAEILLIRVTTIFEDALAQLAYKLAAGALYLDGSAPNILLPCRSLASARTNMLTHNRASPLQSLRWTRAKYIKESVQFVIDPTDDLISTCGRHGSKISEIFKVRNFAAHRTASSRKNFKTVIKSIYGTNRNMQLGNFLLSSNYVRTPNLRRYFV